MTHLRQRTRGFTLVSAVFLVAILSLLSAYLVNFRVEQESVVALDTLATRAFAAARAGTEWGAYNSLRNNACAASTAVALGATLAPFTVTVTCTRSSHNEAGATVSVDTIVANACNQPAAGMCPNPTPGARYVERQVSLTVAQ